MKIHIQEPCNEDWSAMRGCAQRRFCDSCDKDVHDLSAMTRAEAEAVLTQPDVCVRYQVASDGSVSFRPRGWMKAAVVFLALTGTAQASGKTAGTGLLQQVSDWLSSWVQTEEVVVARGAVAHEVHPAEPGVIPEATQPIEPRPIVDVPQHHPGRMGKIALRQPDANETTLLGRPSHTGVP